MYPWPIGEVDNAMDVALDIAMNYLDRTGQAVKFQEVQWTAAMAIATARKGGMRHLKRAVTDRQPHDRHLAVGGRAMHGRFPSFHQSPSGLILSSRFTVHSLVKMPLRSLNCCRHTLNARVNWQLS
jgi:hypothetical protein